MGFFPTRKGLITLITAYKLYQSVGYKTWDDPALTWDQPGLYWDQNELYPAYIDQYLDLVIMQYREKQRFIDSLSGMVLPAAEMQVSFYAMTRAFDVDTAVGVQQDILGQIVGIQRTLPGQAPFDDESYRLVEKSKIGANYWSGQTKDAYTILDALFNPLGYGVLIQNEGDSHMFYALTGPPLDPRTKELFEGGFLSLKPATITIDAYMTKTVQDVPYFGFDVDTDAVAGWGTGAWGNDRGT